MHLYLDESGNTGTNWIDLIQPYFVYGGWLIPDKNISSAEKTINRIFSFSNALELKSKYILDKKIQHFYNLEKELTGTHHAYPIFCIVDKKYMISAKIVETFFDPAYNARVVNGFTYAFEVKKILSGYIYENNDLIEKFSKLIANGTIDLTEMIAIKDILMKHLDIGGFKNASKSIGDLSNDNLLEMIDEFEIISMNGTKKRNLTLIETMLAQLINNANKISEGLHEELQIYVDKLRGYDDVFNELQKVCPKIGWARHSTLISQTDSKCSLIIQSADLLSGFIERCFRKTEQFSNDKDCNAMWNKLVKLRDDFTSVGIIPWEIYGTDELISKISMLVGGEALNKRTSYNYIEVEKYIRL